jgi:hypothetical protein
MADGPAHRLGIWETRALRVHEIVKLTLVQQLIWMAVERDNSRRSAEP